MRKFFFAGNNFLREFFFLRIVEKIAKIAKIKPAKISCHTVMYVIDGELKLPENNFFSIELGKISHCDSFLSHERSLQS